MCNVFTGLLYLFLCSGSLLTMSMIKLTLKWHPLDHVNSQVSFNVDAHHLFVLLTCVGAYHGQDASDIAKC